MIENNPQIMLVEDDLPLAEAVSEYLSKEGLAISVVHDGISAVEQIIETQPALVILDIMLPGKDGLTVCREIRPYYHGFIIMFTAKEDDIDQVVGLELGADDYLIKPVKPRLLLAKVKAFLRRTTMQIGELPKLDILQFGELVIDLSKREVKLNSILIVLTSAEFDLLAVLAKKAGQILSRDDITQQLKGGEYDGLERTIDNKISQLRKKLGDDSSLPTRIKTIRSKGYMLVPGAWDKEKNS
jgi:DNA-binding response OmpR family regulator